MHPKPPKNNVDLRAKKSPAAPPAYRPQPLAQVLQRKARTPVQQTKWPGRTVQLAEAPPQPPPQPPPGPPPKQPPGPAAAVAGGKRKLGGANVSAAEKMKLRGQRFAKEHKVKQDDQQKKQAKRAGLQKDVAEFAQDWDDGVVVFRAHPKARKHQYPNPIATFKSAFEKASDDDLEARQGGQGLEITVKLGGGHTVTGGYQNGILTVFHCGEIQGGVGYGVGLGEED